MTAVTTETPTARRSGAALAIVLLLVVVLNCIVVGTLHLTAQEHHIGSNAARILQLRLDADGGARRALLLWTEAIDTMGSGASSRIQLSPAADIERIGEHLFLIRSEAREPPPRHGRAAAQLIASPPVLPPGRSAAPAPISATASVHVSATGEVSAASQLPCSDPAAPHAMLTPAAAGVSADPGARIDAPPGALAARPLQAAFRRIADNAAPAVPPRDSVLTSSETGVLIVDGDLSVGDGVRFDGLIIVRGSVSIDAGAVMHGAVHATDVTVRGAVRFDPCAVRAAIAAAEYALPRPVRQRAWIPAF